MSGAFGGRSGETVERVHMLLAPCTCPGSKRSLRRTHWTSTFLGEGFLVDIWRISFAVELLATIGRVGGRRTTSSEEHSAWDRGPRCFSSSDRKDRLLSRVAL